MSGKKVDPSKLTLIFEEIMASDELNRLCADCHSKTPRWASTNLGVFLCIKCAGIHRSMGTHISKVKSVSLDGWEDYQIENMRRVGNSRAAKIYEHNLPADHRRPSENDGSRLEYWIRSKYERKLYYNKDLHNALQNGVEISADAGASSAPPMSNAAAGMAATGSRLPRRASNEDIRAVPQNRGAPAAELLSFDAPAPAPAKPQLVNDFFSAPAAAAAPAPVAAAPAPAPASSILSLYTQPIMPTAAPLVPQQGNMMAPAAAMQAPGQAPRQGPNYNVDLSHLRAGAPRPAAAPQYTPQQMMMLQQQQQQMMMMQQQQQQQMMMMQQQQQQQQRMGIPGYMSAMQQPGGYSMPATQQPGYGPLGYRPAPPRQ